MNTTAKTTPRAGWRQAARDAGYLLPGLFLALPSFIVMIVGFFLGLGLFVLAFLGLVIWVATLGAARGFATADRARVSLLEGRGVPPTLRTADP